MSIGLQIIEKLNRSHSLTCDILAKDLGTTNSRIRSEIENMNLQMKGSARIVSKRGRGNGYFLQIDNRKMFLAFMKEQVGLVDRELHSLFSRTEKIAMYLLDLKDYVKLEKISMQFYVSDRQMSADLREVRKMFSNFDLQIKTKPYYGLYVEGEEFNKRLCLANLFMRNIFQEGNGKDSVIANAEVDDQIRSIKRVITEEADKADVHFSDTAIDNLTIHIFVTKERALQGKNRIQKGAKKPLQSELSKNILDRLEIMYNMQFSDYDRQYLDIHVAGKRIYDSHDDLITSEVNTLANEILRKIDEKFLTNYQSDRELNIRLSLHLIPLIIRIKNRFKSANPLAEDIKEQYKISNDMACVAADVINEKYNVTLSQDEISYIALHLELSSYMSKVKKYKILLLCNSGKTSSEILKQQLQMKFSDYISKLDVSSVNQINNYNLDDYTFILTTIPFRTFTSTPIYRIDNFLDNKSISRIDDIMRYGDFSGQNMGKYFPEELFISSLEGTEKAEVLKKMVKLISNHRKISQQFLDSVLEREKLSSTDYGNQVAIPHPFKKMSESVFTCVAVLKHSIKWGINDVRVVMLTSISGETKELQTYYYMLTKTISDESKINCLIKEPTYSNFMKLLMEK